MQSVTGYLQSKLDKASCEVTQLESTKEELRPYVFSCLVVSFFF